MAKNKTTPLPGLERKAIKEIETLADKYAALRDERMEVLKKEVEAKTKLIDAMKRNDQEVYVFEEDGESVTVTLKTEEKVKVKRGTADDEEEE